jgi:hypothetical protein
MQILLAPRTWIATATGTACASATATGLALGAGLLSSLAGLAAAPARAQVPGPSLFGMAEVNPERFLVVAAPIGSSSRSQLNIYEQINGRRPCYSVAPGRPAVVNPLLTGFDFSGICSRYIDANGYSVRVGSTDLATVYRLSVLSGAADTVLMALPTRPGAGPEMVVGRTFGSGTGFFKFELEPGWRLARRQFRGRSLGHLYLYRDSWPQLAETPAALPGSGSSSPAAGATPALPGANPALPAAKPGAPASPPLAGPPPSLPAQPR